MQGDSAFAEAQALDAVALRVRPLAELRQVLGRLQYLEAHGRIPDVWAEPRELVERVINERTGVRS